MVMGGQLHGYTLARSVYINNLTLLYIGLWSILFLKKKKKFVNVFGIKLPQLLEGENTAVFYEQVFDTT